METNTAERTIESEAVDWPREGLEPVARCPACGSTERNRLYDGLTDRVFFCAPGRWTLYQCQGCHSAYLDPRPTPQTIHLAYQAYYTRTRPPRMETQDLRPMRRFVRALANDYRNQRYGSNFQPASKFGALVMRMLPSYRQALDRELRYLPRVSPGASLLDVGFGSGAFLDLARRVGWTVTGVDPDPDAVENARQCGLDVRQGGIEALAEDAEHFDMITLSHVIEHVHDPMGTLEQAFQLLKPGGCLYLETPNIEAAGHKEFGEHWRGLEMPRHLTIFTWAALERILIQAGFEEVSRRVQRDAYSGLAAASRAMRDGKDPYRHKNVTVRDRVKGLFFEIGSHLDPRHSEFITLMAYKPK